MSSKCPCLKIQLAQFSSKSLVGIFQPSFDETTELVLFDTEIRQYVSAIQVRGSTELVLILTSHLN